MEQEHHQPIFHPWLVRARIAGMDPALYVAHKKTIDVWLGHLKTGVRTIEPDARRYWLGKISSDYRWEQGAQLANRRTVGWPGSVDRAHLREPTRRCLGAISTVFRFSAAATQEVLTTFRTTGAPSVPGRRTQRTSNG